MAHSYEEIRAVAVDILAGREEANWPPNQYNHLRLDVAEVLDRRDGVVGQGRHGQHTLSGHDANLFHEVFWELFRQGIITLGSNDANPTFPFCRLSHFGRRIIENQQTYQQELQKEK